MLRKATVLAAMLATATTLAACGGASPSNKLTASSGAQKNNGLKLAECMRSHGVPDYPDPSSGGGFAIQSSANGSNATVSVNGHNVNVSGPALQQAMSRCQKYGPHGPPISGSQLAAIRQGAVKMAECMRSHGVPSFPDPKVSAGPGGSGIQVEIGGGSGTGGGNSGSPKQVTRSSPAFQKAMTTCQKYMRVGPKAQKAAK